MRMIPIHRWLLPCVYTVSMLALIAIVVLQHQSVSKLRQDFGYVEPLCVKLMAENSDLKWRAEAWEKEAVGYREKYAPEFLESHRPHDRP
jgi:hypothetical protein